MKKNAKILVLLLFIMFFTNYMDVVALSTVGECDGYYAPDVDRVVCGWGPSNFIVADGSYKNTGYVTIMRRQLDGTFVFCVGHDDNLPPTAPNVTDPNFCTADDTIFTTNKNTWAKIAIGHLMTKSINYDADYIYIQRAIWKISNEAGSGNVSWTEGLTSNLGGFNDTNKVNSLYNEAKTIADEYINYLNGKRPSISLSEFTYVPDEDFYVATYSIENLPSFITSYDVYGTSADIWIEDEYVYIMKNDVPSDGNVGINLDAYYVFSEAITKDCGDIQPIAEGKKEIPLAYSDTDYSVIDLTGSINLKKKNSLGETINSDEVRVQIYNGNGCVNGQEKRQVNFTGSTTIDLPWGNYSVKELIAPAGYGIDSTCYNFTIEPNQTNSNSITIINKSNCETSLSEILNKEDSGEYTSSQYLRERIKLHQNNYPNFNNLLNFSLTFADLSEACSDYKQTYKKDNSCLYTEQATKSSNNLEIEFNEDNLSTYNDTIKANGKVIGYCLTSFKFNSNITIPTNTIAGQMLINISKDVKFASGKLIKDCYIFDYSGGLGINEVNSYLSSLDGDNSTFYKKYVSNILVDGIALNASLKSAREPGDPATFDVDVTKNEVIKHYDLLIHYTRVLNIDYFLDNSINVSKISGRVCSTSDNDCLFIGNGIITNFNDAKTGKGSFSFKINNENVINKIFDFGSKELQCEYNISPEIITYNNPNGEIELEFRSIDTNTPFNRDTNTNWCSNSSCKYNNNIVKQYILDSNNSYNKTKAGALYTNQTTGTKKIVLTPELIKNIREYNKTHPYDDYELTCDTNGNCQNKFLSEFNITK